MDADTVSDSAQGPSISLDDAQSEPPHAANNDTSGTSDASALADITAAPGLSKVTRPDQKTMARKASSAPSTAHATARSTRQRRRRRLTLPPRKQKKQTLSRRWDISRIVGIRRSNTYTDADPSFQYAVQWVGYDAITWYSAAALDVDAFLAATVTDFLDPQKKKEDSSTQVAWYAPQPEEEVDGAVLTENDEVLACV